MISSAGHGSSFAATALAFSADMKCKNKPSCNTVKHRKNGLGMFGDILNQMCCGSTWKSFPLINTEPKNTVLFRASFEISVL